MKYLLSFITIALLATLPAVGQQTELSYTYDASGNRTSRDYVQGGQKSMQISSADADAGEDTQAITLEEEEEHQLNDVRLYPNPTSGQITVEFTGNRSFEKSSIRVLDMSGKLVRKIERITSINILSLSAFPAGTYIIKVSTGNTTGEWKIVKE